MMEHERPNPSDSASSKISRDLEVLYGQEKKKTEDYTDYLDTLQNKINSSSAASSIKKGSSSKAAQSENSAALPVDVDSK